MVRISSANEAGSRERLEAPSPERREDASLAASWSELWAATPAEHQIDETKAKRAFLAASARHQHSEIVKTWRQHVAIWREEATPPRYVKALWKWLDEDGWKNNLEAVRAKNTQATKQTESFARGTMHKVGTLKPAGQVVRPVLPVKESA